MMIDLFLATCLSVLLDGYFSSHTPGVSQIGSLSGSKKGSAQGIGLGMVAFLQPLLFSFLFVPAFWIEALAWTRFWLGGLCAFGRYGSFFSY